MTATDIRNLSNEELSMLYYQEQRIVKAGIYRPKTLANYLALEAEVNRRLAD